MRAYILVNHVMQSTHYIFCFYCLMQRPGQDSKVKRAILCIFERMEELKRNGRSTFDKPGCSTRVLVRKNQSCCLIGLGGAVIKEMVKSTGAGIEILDETDVPACASHCERVLQASIFLQRKGIIKT